MSIGVVHLVRASNGIEPFSRFVESYRQMKAGANHDLILVFKGFGKNPELSGYRRLLAGLNCKAIFLKDFGFDIRPYFIVARKFKYLYYCFFNSFSIILDENWLAKLFHAISNEKVGLVGATGSYESVYSHMLSLKREYGSFTKKIVAAFRLNYYKKWFDPFPNYHIRTNAFMISGNHMRNIHMGPMLKKIHAMRFESGKSGLTKQILRMNLKALVVGKDGIAYDKEDWCYSNTYALGTQSNLLVSDNRTQIYSKSDLKGRQVISKLAWGDKNSKI